MMTIRKAGRIIGEVSAHQVNDDLLWDAHAMNPQTGEMKFIGSFSRNQYGSGVSEPGAIDLAIKSVKKFKWAK